MNPRVAPRRSVVANAVYALLNPIPFGCFATALIFDVIYLRTAVMQWDKCAAWLIVFGLLFAVVPRLINLAQVWITSRKIATRGDRFDFWLNLFAAGVEMYEYQRTMIHNKLLIADDEIVSVGSTNFDIRSFRPNDEASLNVHDKSFASRMTSVFEDDLGNAAAYTHAMWKQRPWKQKLGEILILPIKSQL